MKALVYNGPWDMTLEELPKPKPASGEILVRVDAVGICGSDVHGFTGESGRRTPGMVMGHEFAGTVVELGSDVADPTVGTRVTIYNIIAETAPSPEEGDPSFLNKQVIGVNLGKRGAMAEYVAVPADTALPLDTGLPQEIALLAEPVGVVTHGWHRLEARNLTSRRLAVVGSGTIGLASVLVARRHGADEIALLDVIAEKTERGRDFGARPVVVDPQEPLPVLSERVANAMGGTAPELVVDAVGTANSLATCLGIVAAGGTVLLIGNLAKEAPLPLQDVVSNEITLVATYGFDRSAFTTALEILPELQQELTTFIEGRCSLAETPAMMTALAKGEKQALKVVIDLNR